MTRHALLTLFVTSSCILFTGCGNESTPEGGGGDTGTTGSTNDTGDDHHGDMRSIGSLTIGEASFKVSFGGEMTPGTEAHFDLEQTSGDAPATVRAWIGVEDGTGSRKAKAGGSGGHFHGHVQVPWTLPEDSALWIEVEQEDGSRASGSLVP